MRIGAAFAPVGRLYSYVTYVIFSLFSRNISSTAKKLQIQVSYIIYYIFFLKEIIRLTYTKVFFFFHDSGCVTIFKSFKWPQLCLQRKCQIYIYVYIYIYTYIYIYIYMYILCL